MVKETRINRLQRWALTLQACKIDKVIKACKKEKKKSPKATEATYCVSVLCFLHGGPGRPLYEAVKVEHKFQWSLQYREDTMTTGNLPRKAADARWSSPQKEITYVDTAYLEGRAAQGCCSTANVNKNPKCWDIKLKNVSFSLLSLGLALVWSFLAMSIPWF